MSRLMNQDTITWVMCSSMLPEEDGLYLVTYSFIDSVKKEMVVEVGFAIYDYIFEQKWHCPFEVISWAKLPEPFTGV